MSHLLRRRLRDVTWSIATLLAVGVLLFPVVWVFLSSVKPDREIMSGHIVPRSITVEHYVAVMRRPDFLIALRNSLVVGLASAVIATGVALPAAYSLARFRYRGREALGLLVLSTQMIPGIAILVPLVVVLRQLGLTNTLPGLTITHITLGLPIAVWMLRGYVEDIPVSLEEAALIDGCSRFGALRRIVAPLVSPAVVAIGTFAFVLSWGEYLLALSLMSSTATRTLPLALQAMFDPYSLSWGQVMAGGVLISLPAITLFMIFRRYLVGGLTAGGVKG